MVPEQRCRASCSVWSEEQSPAHDSSTQVLCFQNNPCCCPSYVFRGKTTRLRCERKGRHDVAVSERKVTVKTIRSHMRPTPYTWEQSLKTWEEEFSQETTNRYHRDSQWYKKKYIHEDPSFLHPLPISCVHSPCQPTYPQAPAVGSVRQTHRALRLSLFYRQIYYIDKLAVRCLCLHFYF